jgi:hypothetical protein
VNLHRKGGGRVVGVMVRFRIGFGTSSQLFVSSLSHAFPLSFVGRGFGFTCGLCLCVCVYGTAQAAHGPSPITQWQAIALYRNEKQAQC